MSSPISAVQHAAEIGHQRVDVDAPRLIDVAAAEGQELPGQRRGAGARALDLVEVRAQRIVGVQVVEHQLGERRVDHREQVVEVVGDAAGELADRVHLADVRQPSLEPLGVGDVEREADDQRAAVAAGARGHAGLQVDDAAVGPHPAVLLEPLLPVDPAGVDAAQVGQIVGVDVGDPARRPGQPLGGDAQHVGGVGAHPADREAVVAGHRLPQHQRQRREQQLHALRLIGPRPLGRPRRGDVDVAHHRARCPALEAADPARVPAARAVDVAGVLDLGGGQLAGEHLRHAAGDRGALDRPGAEPERAAPGPVAVRQRRAPGLADGDQRATLVDDRRRLGEAVEQALREIAGAGPPRRGQRAQPRRQLGGRDRPRRQLGGAAHQRRAPRRAIDGAGDHQHRRADRREAGEERRRPGVGHAHGQERGVDGRRREVRERRRAARRDGRDRAGRGDLRRQPLAARGVVVDDQDRSAARHRRPSPPVVTLITHTRRLWYGVAGWTRWTSCWNARLCTSWWSRTATS
jgi:hypothetical protein